MATVSRLSLSSSRLLRQKAAVPVEQSLSPAAAGTVAPTARGAAAAAAASSLLCPLLRGPRRCAAAAAGGTLRQEREEQQQQQHEQPQQRRVVWGAGASRVLLLTAAAKRPCAPASLHESVGCVSSAAGSSRTLAATAFRGSPAGDGAGAAAARLRRQQQQQWLCSRGFCSSSSTSGEDSSAAAAAAAETTTSTSSSSSGATRKAETQSAATQKTSSSDAAREAGAHGEKHVAAGAAVEEQKEPQRGAAAATAAAEDAEGAAAAAGQRQPRETRGEHKQDLQQAAEEQPARGQEEEEKGEVHAFRAETKKLLQIVTHSLYTDKEVFVRELISNSADALEKLRFLQATAAEETDAARASLPLQIYLSGDPEKKTFTLQDTGVGMTKEELLQHLGTIAKSGSLDFLMKHQAEKNTDIIGQFGVGFYSSFVVSDRVDVFSRSHAAGAKAYVWSSDGSGQFTIKELPESAAAAKALVRGTKIVCHLKKDCLEFANVHTLQSCASKFSSFINFPISIREKDGKEVAVTTQEALWLKPKATPEEHTQFFRYLSNQSWGQPMYTITYRADAPLSIKGLFYVPEDPPSRLFQSTSSSEVGVALHARRVLVQRAATDVIPRWLGFLRGVVDCDDMPLNVSRERMQNTALMEKLSHVLVKRILRFFDEQAQTDPKKYIDFYWKYAQQLKEGVLDDAHNGSRHKNELLQLLRFQCSEKEEGQLISLDDYLAMIKPEQQNIYVYCCPGRETALASPYMEQFKEKKRPVLLLTDDIDEFVTMNVQTYKGKKFVAIDSPEEDFEPLLEEKDETADTSTSVPGLVGVQRQELERFAQSTLGGRVSAVKFSDRLLKTPAVVTGFLSSTLRKMMKATLQGAPEAQLRMASLPVTLEFNPHHQLISSIYHLMQINPDVAKLLVEQLYDNARVAAGLMEDPRCMVERLNHLLEMTAQYAYHHGKAGAAPAAEQTDGAETKPKAAEGDTVTAAATQAADGERTDSEKKAAPSQEKESTGSRIHV